MSAAVPMDPTNASVGYVADARFALTSFRFRLDCDGRPWAVNGSGLRKQPPRVR
jgi:hypothetical protein